MEGLGGTAKALKEAVRTLDEYNSGLRPAAEHEKDLEKLKTIHDKAKGVDKKFKGVKQEVKKQEEKAIKLKKEEEAAKAKAVVEARAKAAAEGPEV